MIAHEGETAQAPCTTKPGARSALRFDERGGADEVVAAPRASCDDIGPQFDVKISGRDGKLDEVDSGAHRTMIPFRNMARITQEHLPTSRGTTPAN